MEKYLTVYKINTFLHCLDVLYLLHDLVWIRANKMSD